MSRETAFQDLEKLSEEEADILNNDPELLASFKKKHGLDQPKKSFARRATEAVVRSPTLPIAGAIGGGLLGSGLASIPLAGAGGAGGEAWRQVAARGLGIEAPPTSLVALKKIGSEGGKAALGQAIGFGAVKGLSFAGKAVVPKVAQLGQKLTRIPKEAFETALTKPLRFFTAPFKKTVEKAYAAAGFPLEKQTAGEIIENPKLVKEVIEKGTMGTKAVIKRGTSALKSFVEEGIENPKAIIGARKGLDKEISLLKNQILIGGEKGASTSALQSSMTDKLNLRSLLNESLDRMAPAFRKADALASKNLSVAPFRKAFLPGQFHFISPRGLLSIVPGLPTALGAATSAIGAGGRALTSGPAVQAAAQGIARPLTEIATDKFKKKKK